MSSSSTFNFLPTTTKKDEVCLYPEGLLSLKFNKQDLEVLSPKTNLLSEEEFACRIFSLKEKLPSCVRNVLCQQEDIKYSRDSNFGNQDLLKKRCVDIGLLNEKWNVSSKKKSMEERKNKFAYHRRSISFSEEEREGYEFPVLKKKMLKSLPNVKTHKCRSTLIKTTGVPIKRNEEKRKKNKYGFFVKTRECKTEKKRKKKMINVRGLRKRRLKTKRELQCSMRKSVCGDILRCRNKLKRPIYIPDHENNRCKERYFPGLQSLGYLNKMKKDVDFNRKNSFYV